jgi:hypothetical protein
MKPLETSSNDLNWLPPADEWDFRTLPEEECRFAFFWEYCRSLRTIDSKVPSEVNEWIKGKHSFPNAYLAAYINSIDLAPFVSGTAQPKLNQANMNTIPVPVPPLAEQQEIERRVAGLFALADQLEQRLAQARKQVDKLTPSLLARAFAGQLVPQNPADEPAEKLLARVQAAWKDNA